MAEDTMSGRASSSALQNTEDELSELFLRFSNKEDIIKGFVGRWVFYQPDFSIASEFRCLRTYDLITPEIGTSENVKFQTFNEFEPTNGKARKRSIDGIYESSHLRSSTDLFFSDNTSMSAASLKDGFPECVYWRSVAIDNEHVMRIAPNLPPNPNAEGEDKYPNWTALNGQAGVFAFETFLMVGQDRWSMGALYSLADLNLISHFCICERLTTVDPSKPMNFDKFSYREPAGRLSLDTESWVPVSEYRGEMTELIWDEDGEAMRLPTRPASFSPPDAYSASRRLFLYDDACYAYYPLKLPEVHSEGAKQFGEGAMFEMGLLHQEEGVKNFRRLILRYSAAGKAVSLTKELFKSDGSFEFDRRRSHSVKRTVGSRRRMDPVVPAKTAEQRAAKLRDAFGMADAEHDGEVHPQAASPLPRMQSGGSDTLDNSHVSRVIESHSRART